MNKLLQHVKKLTIMSKREDSMFELDNVPDNIADFNLKIKGPEHTPYQGAKFLINICIKNPDSYPKDVPDVKFVTKIFHPNIHSESGTICLDILKNQWAGHLMTLENIIQNIYSLMQTPNPNDPYNVVITGIYKKSYNEYLRTIVACTKEYGEKYSNYLSEKEIEELCK